MRKKAVNDLRKGKSTETVGGTMPKINTSFVYPKRYEVLLDLQPNGDVSITRTAENMTTWELYGVLKMLLLRLEKIMLIGEDATMTED